MAWLVGIDVGGTFTDFYAVSDGAAGDNSGSAENAVHYFKRPSTPDNPGEAIIRGLQEMAAEIGLDPKALTRLCHGTTVATNALLQRKGGKVALITTAGFRDLLEIGRQTRPHMYSLQLDQPPPLVPRERRLEIEERIDSNGAVHKPLTDEAIDAAVRAVGDLDVEACAVGLLFAFLNDDHEQRIGNALRRANSELHVSLSAEVQPEFREYERFSTTVLNAYLQPVLSRYFSYLEDEMAGLAPDAPIRIYQSSGGLMSVGRAKQFPIRTALSGPAAGAVGAVHEGLRSDRPNVVTLDMGGTSADVALIRDGDPGISFDRDVAGFPVRLPMVDIHTVGAGGGSIAWFDRDGLMKVGPLSAGADPGPACYGRGGTEATVTDANLVLGRLSPGGLVGGSMPLDVAAARAALTAVADGLGFGVEKTALGVLGIAVANMVRAVRTISVERGHDPRDYALMPFGGAGPLHAVDVARTLGMTEIIVPVAPGILCAQGLIVSDLKEDFVRSGLHALTPENEAGLRAILDALAAEANAWFDAEDIDPSDRCLDVILDSRYVGQNFELPVEFSGADLAGALPPLPDIDAIRQQFFDVHTRYYGFHNPHDPIEVANLRVTATGRLTRAIGQIAVTSGGQTPNPRETHAVWFEENGAVDTPVYDRADLGPGLEMNGPAIVEQLDSTTVIHPGDHVRVDDAGNILITVAGTGK